MSWLLSPKSTISPESMESLTTSVAPTASVAISADPMALVWMSALPRPPPVAVSSSTLALVTAPSARSAVWTSPSLILGDVTTLFGSALPDNTFGARSAAVTSPSLMSTDAIEPSTTFELFTDPPPRSASLASPSLMSFVLIDSSTILLLDTELAPMSSSVTSAFLMSADLIDSSMMSALPIVSTAYAPPVEIARNSASDDATLAYVSLDRSLPSMRAPSLVDERSTLSAQSRAG